MIRFSIILLFICSLLLGSNFSDGLRAFKSGSYREAKALFEKALTKDGAQQAQFFLGLIYLKGLGVEKNLPKAEKYLAKVSREGNIRAKCYLAEVYLSQKRPKTQKALQLLREGQQGGADECQNIAKKYKLSL